MIRSVLLLSALLLLALPAAWAQAPPGYLYDEAKVPEYRLPDPLRGLASAADWPQRRSELRELFAEQVYGRVPSSVKAQVEWEIVEGPSEAFGGWREQIHLWPFGKGKPPRLDLLLYRPKREGPVPLFLGMNFYGNQTVYPDPAIALASGWVATNKGLGIDGHRATEASRGARASRWPVEVILQRGYGLCTLYYGDVDPDRDDFSDGVHSLFLGPDQQRSEDGWGSLAAWAWALSRVQDVLVQHPKIDNQRVAVMGHSRLGKTALWAGANDTRFGMVISNDSGCGGAALSRRKFGETLERINSQFPHWFCMNFHRYNGREQELPLDQNMLLALIAPRPLYVASASADLWADPRGEYLAAKEASKVYQFLGVSGLPEGSDPRPGEVRSGLVSYHLRPGRHDLTLWDWNRFMDAADQRLK